MASRKPVCKYGAACYRKNPEHLKEFAHPGRMELESTEPSVLMPPHKPKTEKKHTRESPAAKRKAGLSITSYFTKKQPPSTSMNSTNSEGVSNVCAGDEAPNLNSPPAKRKRLEESVDETQYVGDHRRESYVDDDELLKESNDDRKNVKRKFLVDMPEDFYMFWEFCKTLKPINPCGALKHSLGLELTGPYDILGGNLKGIPWEKCVLHSRHYYDPPEFVTVLTQQTDSDHQTGYHIGYFRDDPKSTDCLVVSNHSKEGCEFQIAGESLFSVIRMLITKRLEDKSLSAELKKELKKLVTEVSSSMAHCHGVKMKDLVKQRNKVMLTKCFHKMGLVVPYDETTEVGYRPLPMTDRELWRLLNKISNCSQDDKKRDLAFEPLQEIITLVQFANDECDYGMGLELGIDLFCHGDQYFHTAIEQLLPLAYDLLQREEYSKICLHHLKNREEEPLDFRVKLC